jgi:hypothetical protein
MAKKIRKITPYTPAWEREANALARSYAPTMYPCKKCGHPVGHGYCCTGCGDSDPSTASSDS